MFRKKIFFLVMLFMLTSLILCSGDAKVIKIKNDEVLMVKLAFKIANTAPNLKNIKISYDKSGNTLLTDVEASINPKDPYTIVIPPPMGGWYNDVKYYLIVDKTVKLSGNKNNNTVVTRAFEVDKSKFYTISGRISLPNKQTAPVDMKLTLWTVNCNDPVIQNTQEVEIKKGKQSVDYKMQLPENKSGYYISYEMPSDFEFDFIGLKGYIGKAGFVEEHQLSKQHFLSKNLTVDIALPQNKAVCDAARQIIKKAVKPGMSDYDKVKSLYNYVSSTTHYNISQYNPFKNGELAQHYSGNKLSHALVEKTAVCSGFSNAYQYLFGLVGIESDIRAAHSLGTYFPMGHVWNVVRLDGKYYNLEATAVRSGISSRFAFNKSLDYMLFSDQRIAGSYIFNDKKSYNCANYDYSTNFYEYWLYNQQEKGVVRKLKGTIKLPDGEVSPQGGMLVRVTASTGHETKATKDDFSEYTSVFIPGGKSQADYQITVVSTPKAFRVSAESLKYGITRASERRFYSQVAKLEKGSSDYSKVPILELQEAEYLTGEIFIDESIKRFREDISLFMYAEEYDGSSSWGRLDSIYMDAVTIVAGSASAKFKIPVPRHAQELLLSYEIMNVKPVKEFYKIGYLSSTGTASDYNKALKINASGLKEKYTLNLIAK